MQRTKTLASSLLGGCIAYFPPFRLTVITVTAVRLFISFIWHRARTLIWWLWSGGPLVETTRTRSTRLPFELVEIIIAYLI